MALLRLFPGLETRHLLPGSECPPLKEGTMRFYNMRFCPYAQRTMIALALKELPVEVVNVNLKYKPDWFLARNPLGKVPILETHDTVVFESGVCNEWLDEAFPHTRQLLPKNPADRAQQKMLTEMLTRLNNIMFLLYRKAGEERAHNELRDTLNMIEDLLKDRAFFGHGGQEVGWADVMEWPWFERLSILQLQGHFQPSDYPRITAYRQRMEAIPAIAVTMRPPEHLLAFTASFIQMIGKARDAPDYDYGLPAAANL